MSRKILLEGTELSFNRDLAKAIGVDGAIVMQYIHNCLLKSQEEGVNYIEGKYWVVKSLKRWQKDVFYFWNESAVRRIFTSLEKKGILIGCKLTKRDFDHTKWYTIDYEELDTLISMKNKNL